MSLLNDFTNFIEKNFNTPTEVAQQIDRRLESGKALLGETLEYAAPEGTRRRGVLNKMAQVGQAVGAGLSTAALLTDKENPAYRDGFQISDIAEHIVDLHNKFPHHKQYLVHQISHHLMYQEHYLMLQKI